MSGGIGGIGNIGGNIGMAQMSSASSVPKGTLDDYPLGNVHHKKHGGETSPFEVLLNNLNAQKVAGSTESGKTGVIGKHVNKYV